MKFKILLSILIIFNYVCLSVTEERVVFHGDDVTLNCLGNNVRWYFNGKEERNQQNETKIEVHKGSSTFKIAKFSQIHVGTYECKDNLTTKFELKVFGMLYN
jgi:hypothetical protein